MTYKRNIFAFYLYTFFSGAIFAYVIERLFWADRGMTIQDVVLIEIIYSLVVVSLELPTGMIADRFSRKTWIVLDAFAGFIEFLILIFAREFWHFALAITISAIGHAFQSGAFNALLYDSLKADGREKKFEQVKGRISALDYIAVGICSLIGGFVATHQPLVTTYWMSLISVGIAFLISLSIKEVRVGKQKKEPWDLRDWQQIFGYILHHRIILMMVIVGIVTGSIINYLDEFWQIYLYAIDLPVWFFGVMIVLTVSSAALGEIIAYWFKEKLGINKTLSHMLVLTVAGFILLSLFPSLVMVLVILIIYFASAVVEPLIYGYLHQEALPEYRATIESVYSLLLKGAVALIGLPFGLISTRYTIFAGFGYLAIIASILLVIYLLFQYKRAAD